MLSHLVPVRKQFDPIINDLPHESCGLQVVLSTNPLNGRLLRGSEFDVDVAAGVTFVPGGLIVDVDMVDGVLAKESLRLHAPLQIQNFTAQIPYGMVQGFRQLGAAGIPASALQVVGPGERDLSNQSPIGSGTHMSDDHFQRKNDCPALKVCEELGTATSPCRARGPTLFRAECNASIVLLLQRLLQSQSSRDGKA